MQLSVGVTSAALLAASLVSSGEAAQVAAAAALSLDASAAKNRPVSKVIKLLKDMQKQLEKDAEEDEEIYDKMACWCETNKKEKTKSIKDAQDRIADLTIQIEEGTANAAQLATEIKGLEKEVLSNQNSLAKATSVREKELEEFNGEEKDLLESISALKAAVTVLGKHNDASLVQVSRQHALTIGRALEVRAPLLKSVLKPSERQLALSFLQDANPQPGSYAPQSGQIFGILTQMKDTFEENLASTQKDEAKNAKEYAEVKAAKTEEINAGQDQVDKKTNQMADAEEKVAQAKADVEDTKESLSADEQFLMKLEEKCKMTDGEWEARQKTRRDEIDAVSKALEVLSGDDAHDLFTRTFNFMQVKASSSMREHASRVLRKVAAKYGNAELGDLASQVKLDAFTRVKKAIDEMVTELREQQANEVKHKDFCTEEFNTNQLQTEKRTREKKEITAEHEDLTMKLKQLTEEIDTLKGEIKEMTVQLKRAGEDRENQNKEFQTTVSDQRATQGLLKAALSVLEDFYGKQAAAAAAAAALVQQSAGQAPPPGFEEYKKNAGSTGVMGMIKQIMTDAKEVENEAIRSEADAQKAYEDFVKESNGSIEAKGKSIEDKAESKAKAEDELVEAKKALLSVNVELDQLAKYKSELHASCDFTLKNFDLRQAARAEEIDALGQAKSILSGAKL